MLKLLTDRFLRGVKPPASGRETYKDSRVPGLELRVSFTGEKSWSIRYRPRGCKQERETLPDSYPVISLSDARARATALAAAARRGIDLPAAERLAEEEKRKAAAAPRTLGALCDAYVEGYCKATQVKWRQTARALEMHVKPRLGKRELTALRRADFVELFDHLQYEKGLGAQVNQVRAQLRAAMAWAVDRDLVESNLVATVRRRNVGNSRERVLSDGELRAVWFAADRLPELAGRILRVLLLTGQRREEVTGLLWGEIDLAEGVWHLPAARNKSKRDHDIPLAHEVVRLLGAAGLPESPVFTVCGRTTPYSGLSSTLKDELDEASGVRGWVLHDLRRTVRTGLAKLDIREEVAEAVLNHSRGGLTKIYNRHTYEAEKRVALERWADYVMRLVGADAKVVALGTRR